MLYTIENECLKVSINDMGAELQSVFSKKTNVEYLWQGNPEYWAGHAYNLFPTIGRMIKGKYIYKNKEYAIRLHGLARYYEFALEKQTANSLVFLFKDNEETRAAYPFRFEFRAIYTLNGNALTVRCEATNLGEEPLICSFGGHPGFNVPFDKGNFDDYYLEFDKNTISGTPRQQLVSINYFMEDKTAEYPLVDDTKIPLRHDLFDGDAIILENTPRCVDIKSPLTSRFVRVKFDDFKFIGFWHTVKKDAPFVCIEPWTALPAIEGKTTNLETKANMYHIPTGETQGVEYIVEIHE